MNGNVNEGKIPYKNIPSSKLLPAAAVGLLHLSSLIVETFLQGHDVIVATAVAYKQIFMADLPRDRYFGKHVEPIYPHRLNLFHFYSNMLVFSACWKF